MKLELFAAEAKKPAYAPIKLDKLAPEALNPAESPRNIPFVVLNPLEEGFTEYNVDPVVWIEGIITFKACDAVTARDDEVANDALKAYEALIVKDDVVANELLVANDELIARDDEIANEAVNGFITPG